MSDADDAVDDVGEVIVSKAKLVSLLKWSPERLNRMLEREADFPVRSRGDRGVAWEFELHEVAAFIGRKEAEREREAAAVREAKQRDDPREARLAVQAKRIERTARKMSAGLVDRADCLRNVEVLRSTLSDWTRRLAADVKRFDLPPGAEQLFNQLIGDGTAKFVGAVEGFIARSGDHAE